MIVEYKFLLNKIDWNFVMSYMNVIRRVILKEGLVNDKSNLEDLNYICVFFRSFFLEMEVWNRKL